ncbi:hypothetical protein KR51_00017240 [Rubidibacter lacunae KORDI 51-2]|uniref:Uncharacterized protein n=1 Tax=Rubidibacter lacunae KORDI 51-2 TaxID=582515 RepID=U5DIZ5_9CHRO|nr:hypothetical protein KR51_00017240 [Rubidibacter lacunae KORDI 51-2]
MLYLACQLAVYLVAQTAPQVETADLLGTYCGRTAY